MSCEQEAIAYHEAGHAVIGRVLGMTCEGATIVPDYDEGVAGHAVTHVERSISDWDARGRLRWVSMYRARIMTLMAGRESEIEVFGKASDARFGDDYDLRYIDEVIEEANVDAASLAKMRVRVRGLVRRHRDVITKVATALLTHRSLSAEQIDEIVITSGVPMAERIDPTIIISFEERYFRHIAWATGKVRS